MGIEQSNQQPGRALVTGGGRRIGRAIAVGLAAQKWSVAVHYHSSAAAAEATVHECLKAGAPTATAIRCDLSSAASRGSLVRETANQLGGALELLINNAASFQRDSYTRPDSDTAATNLQVNLVAPLELSQQFVDQFHPTESLQSGRAGKLGNIINVLDAEALRPSSDFASYMVAKCGLVALTRNAALALAPRIRVNGVAPGPTLPAPRESEQHFTRSRQLSPLQMGPTPADVANAVLYLLANPTVTGHILPIDGGLHLVFPSAGQNS